MEDLVGEVHLQMEQLHRGLCRRPREVTLAAGVR